MKHPFVPRFSVERFTVPSSRESFEKIVRTLVLESHSVASIMCAFLGHYMSK